MSKNKSVRKELERLYGRECFIDKLHLRKDKQKYKGKAQYKRMKQLTYHHIKPKKDGGEATIQNGALLSEENHAWFHKQSIKKQNEMNEAFQEYKMAVGTFDTQKIREYKSITINMDEHITIPLIEDRDRETRKQRRAREKRELRRELEERGY